MKHNVEAVEDSGPDVLVPDAVVRGEFGDVTSMSVWRWDNDPQMAALGWPPPVKIRNRVFRFRSQIEQFKQNLLRQAIEARSNTAEHV